MGLIASHTLASITHIGDENLGVNEADSKLVGVMLSSDFSSRLKDEGHQSEVLTEILSVPPDVIFA